MHIDEYGSRPCYGELVAIVLVGLVHILVEIGFSERLATACNVAVSIAFLGYLLWRIRRTIGVLRTWGLRRDNFWSAGLAQLRFMVVGVLAVIAVAAATKSLSLPVTFWLTVILYPAWGIAQQFALQNLIANNLTQMLTTPVALAVGSAALFAISHYPKMELVALTFVGGIFFTLIYRRNPNLWAVGIAHGVLGSLAFYLILQEDPGAAILTYLSGH